MANTPNDQLLAACNFPHDFVLQKSGTTSKCTKCGGVLSTTDAKHYAEALVMCAADLQRKKPAVKV